MVDVGPVGPVEPATSHTPAALPAPRCWCGEDGVEIVPGEDRAEIGQPGERLCYAGHTFHEGPAHRILRKFAEIGVPIRLDPELWREREEAVAKLATGLDLPPDVLLGSGGAHWTAARDAQRADMGLPFYVLACLECDPDTVIPFGDPAERGRWAAEHRLGTGHDRWWCMDLSGGADGDAEMTAAGDEVTAAAGWCASTHPKPDRTEVELTACRCWPGQRGIRCERPCDEPR